MEHEVPFQVLWQVLEEVVVLLMVSQVVLRVMLQLIQVQEEVEVLGFQVLVMAEPAVRES